MRGIASALGILALLAAGTAHAEAFALQRVATGLARPVFVTAPPGDGARVFIVEQFITGQTFGRIRILDLATGEVLATPFLTVSGLATGNEQGLLGLAFHPDYANNGFFYVYFTDPDSKVVRYEVSADPNVADASSATAVLGFDQPQANHNGGWIAFGSDDLLYIASGDGGNADDLGSGHTLGTGNAQDITGNWLGKILRIDVDGDAFPGDPDRNYAIPANPFVGVTGDDEIWVYGLRNPWRASFDRGTGDLYIGDVGQGACEEIDVQPAASTGGENYGWRLREGTIQNPNPAVGGAAPGAIDPILDYPHAGTSCGAFDPAGFVGNVVTGGYVYRGPITSLQGRYFFADFSTADLWSLVWNGTVSPVGFGGANFSDLVDHSTDPAFTQVGGTIDTVSSFGEDDDGNLYLLDLDGDVFRLPEPSAAAMQILGVATVLALWRWRRRERQAEPRRRPA